MFPTLLRAISLYAISWTVWRVLRRYWTKSPIDELPGPPQHSWLFGNIPQLFNQNGWTFHFDMLKNYGSTMRFSGILGERMLVTYDPKALHHIFVKDQCVYKKSAMSIARGRAFLGEGVATTLGEQHRKQRKMMNPLFSINHMREMIPLFYEVTERLRLALRKRTEKGPQEIDVLQWMTRTALELIGQSGMGYSFDSLEDDQDSHPYSTSVKKLVPLIGGTLGFVIARLVLPIAAKLNFPRLKKFIVQQIPSERVQETIRVVDVMAKTSLEIIEAKKKALAGVDPQILADAEKKKDIISVLMRANASASEEDRLTDTEVIGQVSTFVFAGMDTTSSALSRILHLLATHPNVQDRLRDEIRETQKDGQLSYDQLVSLPYLDAVCRETLRVHPPLTIAGPREATQDIILPLSKPILDLNGREVSEVFVPKGTSILMSVLGANCNPDLWGPDSYEWKPERWLSPLPETVGQAHMPGIYSHLMTFSGGSHACIGFKFSQLEMKVVLSVLISNFKFSETEKKITWRMTGIVSPALEGADQFSRPQLPLRMSLVE